MQRAHLIAATAAGAVLLTAAGTARATLGARILAPDGTAQDRFGYTVAINGTTAVVGAPGDNPHGSLSGSAYVFVRNGAAWTFQAKLSATDGAAMASFGQRVAVSNNTILVGAPYGDASGTATAGVAYVFVRSGTSWSQQAKLAATDPHAFDYFGSTLSLDQDTAVIGAPYADVFGADSGAAYVFTRSGTTWTQQTKLFPAAGQSADLFGSSVSVDQNTIAVGAPADDDNGIASGFAFIYIRSGTTWSVQQKLRPTDGVNDDQFGAAVSLDGDRVAIGAPDRDDLGVASGAVYVFSRTGSFWAQEQKLVPADGAAGDTFGSAVALGGTTLIAGAFLDDQGGATDAGSAYVYARGASSWTLREKLVHPAPATDDGFGVAVATDLDWQLVGVEQDDDSGSESGSVFTAAGTPPPASQVPALGNWHLVLLALGLVVGGLSSKTKRRASHNRNRSFGQT